MSTTADLTWTTARDGSRTAQRDGQWLAGCSVPMRSAEMMLRKLQVKGNVICLLYPSHAQQIDVLMKKLDPSCAAIVIAKDMDQIDLFNQCCDFSAQINKRIFFAFDMQSMESIFKSNPGLPIPQQFIRLPITPQDQSDLAIKWAQQVFSSVSTSQSQLVTAALENWEPVSTPPVAMVRSQFALWNDAGHTLASVLGDKIIDLSDAKQTSNAYITQQASQASALITVDFARADQKDLLHPDQPWISWITQGHVPAYIAASPNDALLLVDSSLKLQALAKGWPEDRLAIASYPQVNLESTGATELSMICNVPSINPPEVVQEFSSWRLVWEAVQKDLVDNPHRLAGDMDGYLEKARKYFSVPSDNFPKELFINQLIAPAYCIGIAKWLMREGIEFSIYGQGFDPYPELKTAVRSPVTTHESLAAVLKLSSGLINPFLNTIHPIRSIARPQVSTFGRTPQRILQDILAIQANRCEIKPVEQPLNRELILKFINLA